MHAPLGRASLARGVTGPPAFACRRSAVFPVLLHTPRPRTPARLAAHSIARTWRGRLFLDKPGPPGA